MHEEDPKYLNIIPKEDDDNDLEAAFDQAKEYQRQKNKEEKKLANKNQDQFDN